MRRIALLLALASAVGCDDSADPPPTTPPPPPTSTVDLAVTWRPTDHSVGSWMFFRADLTIENRGTAPLPASSWALYFNFVRRVLKDGDGDGTTTQELAAQGIAIAHADRAGSGDYYALTPLANFAPLPPGEKRTFSVLASDWAVLKTDAPSGFHLVLDGKPARAVAAKVELDAADPKQTTRFEDDRMPVESAATRFAENPPRMQLAAADQLLPAPRQIVPGAGELRLGGAIAIAHGPGLAREAAFASAALTDVLDATYSVTEGATGKITLAIDPALDVNADGKPDPEGYTLEVKPTGVAIRGRDAAGVFYGVQTLRQLVPAAAYLAAVDPTYRLSEIVLREQRIADAPGFVYRGMHLDVGRHFQSKETVKRLLDVMAFYKLNKFHFHLTDDEGWRIEIPEIPELTEYGGRRGADLDETAMLHIGLGAGNDLAEGDGITGKAATAKDANGGVVPAYQGFETATLNFVGKGSGYYTARDFEEILAYATERHINVIPEIDLPGHARAAVKAMEYRFEKYRQSDPAKAAQYRLLDPADTSKHTSVQMYTDNFVNPCLDSSYAFMTTVVSALKARYAAVPGAKLDIIHAGGDELPGLANNVWWQGSPLCKSHPTLGSFTDTQLFDHFFTRWHAIITATGAAMTGWDDIVHGGLALPGFIPMPWSNVWGWGREDDAYRYANEGAKVILSHATNLYMDLAYNKDPDEPGYYWANFVDDKKTFEYRPFDIYVLGTQDRMGNPIDPATWATKVRLTAAGKANVLGMHGLLWGENLKSPQLVEYFAFPKLLGVAERAWNPDPPLADMAGQWVRYANRLGQEILPRLGAYRTVDLRSELPDTVGVNYRLPLAGAQLAAGKLTANVRYPGFAIEYSLDGGTTWLRYPDSGEPVSASGRIGLRSVAPDGRTSRLAWVQ